MQTLKVIAYISSGIDTSNPWSPSLDGILASAYLEHKLGTDKFNIDMALNKQSTVANLDIAKSEGDEWFYLCSSPIFAVDQSQTFTQYKRFNHDEHDLIKMKAKQLQLTKGVHKNTAWNANVKYCEKVEWHVASNKDYVLSLLQDVTHIGANRAAGYGKVDKWAVEEGEDLLARYYRPLPLNNTICDDLKYHKMWWGYRPSVRIKSNQAYCNMPLK